MKVHMLDVHLNEFKKTLGAYSEEHGECFHQDIKDFECQNQRQYNENMMGDYTWGRSDLGKWFAITDENLGKQPSFS